MDLEALDQHYYIFHSSESQGGRGGGSCGRRNHHVLFISCAFCGIVAINFGRLRPTGNDSQFLFSKSKAIWLISSFLIFFLCQYFAIST